MDFSLSEDHRHIQTTCRRLAAEFATRAAEHDREATSPRENLAAIRDAGLFGLIIPKEFGGLDGGMLGYTTAESSAGRSRVRPRDTWGGIIRRSSARLDPAPPTTFFALVL